MKTNLRERLTRYQCFIRPKVHFAPEFSFNFKVNFPFNHFNFSIFLLSFLMQDTDVAVKREIALKSITVYMGEEVEDLIKDFLVNQDLFSNGEILAKAVQIYV